MPPQGYIKWDNSRRKILAMHIRGKETNEIAKKLGWTPRHISGIIGTERFQREKAAVEQRAQERVVKLFEEKAEKAAQKIIKLAEEGKPNERIQLDAAKEILYQVGVKPVEVIETRKREYTPEEMESSLKVAKETEEIAERLGKSKSGFLLEKTEEMPLPPAPVAASEPVEVEPETVSPIITD